MQAQRMLILGGEAFVDGDKVTTTFKIKRKEATIVINVPRAKEVSQLADASGSPTATAWPERLMQDRITSRIGQIQRDLGLG